MKPEKLSSILALITPIVLAAITAFQPQIQEFLAHYPAIGIVVTFLIIIWNNISQPIHK